MHYIAHNLYYVLYHTYCIFQVQRYKKNKHKKIFSIFFCHLKNFPYLCIVKPQWCGDII